MEEANAEIARERKDVKETVIIIRNINQKSISVFIGFGVCFAPSTSERTAQRLIILRHCLEADMRAITTKRELDRRLMIWKGDANVTLKAGGDMISGHKIAVVISSLMTLMMLLFILTV